MRTRGPKGARAMLLATIAAAALICGGCGGGGSGHNAAGVSTAKAKPGGTLRLADQSEAVTLNPYTAQDNNSEHVFAQILEPLFRTNGKGQVVPCLALSAKPSNDYRTWTVALRPNVKFQDGRPLTAADVVFSLNEVRKSPNWTAMFQAITAVRAASPSSVLITTSEPFPAMETTLSLPFAAIVPVNFGGLSEKEFGQRPIGTGPFKFVSWEHGQSIALERYKEYWQKGQPLLDKVIFESVAEDTSRVLQLHGGELDLVAGPPASQVPSLESTPGLRVGRFALAYPDYLMFNVRFPLFANSRVREAVDLAVNREAVVKAALHGIGQVGGSWFPPSLRSYDQSIRPPARDVAKARQLLAEAVKAGASPSFTLRIGSGEEYSRLASQIIQEDLQQVGFKVTIQQLDESALLEQVSAGKYDATLFALTSDIVEPSEATSFYLDLNAFWTGASTAQVKKLFAEATVQPNVEKRTQLYHAIQQHVATEREMIVLDYRPWVWAMHSNVAGFELSPTGVPWLAETGFSG